MTVSFPISIHLKLRGKAKNNIYDSNGDATSDYTLTGITGGVGSRNGSYTTLELPHKIKLSYIQIQTRNSDDFSATLNPKQIYVYGSNNGSSWTQVGSHIFHKCSDICYMAENQYQLDDPV
jgi:hypothetical protein